MADRDLTDLIDGLPYDKADREHLRSALMNAFRTEQSALEWLTSEHVRFGKAPIDRARHSRSGLVEVWMYLRKIGGIGGPAGGMVQK